jgi:hypothetical protein
MTIKGLTVFLLLFIFVATVSTSVNTKSPICDEAAHHIAAGYSYIKTHDFRITPSPPLIRLLIGLPIVFLNPKLPLDHISWKTADSSGFNYQFLFVYNHNADQIVLFGRLLMIVLAAILGILIFAWSRKLYGYRAGIFALFLYTFSPIILGNAGLAMLDLGCAAFIFAAVFQFYRYLKKQTFADLLLTGVLFGLAQAAKITALVLYPIFVVYAAAYWLLNRRGGNVSLWGISKKLIFIWVMGIIVLWGTYFFEFKPLLKNEPDVQEKIEYIKKFSASVPFVKDRENMANNLVWLANNVPIPLSTYGISIMGFGRQIVFGEQGLYFMGRNMANGSKIYYAVLYLIRTPIPFIIFLAATFLFFIKPMKKRSLEDLFLLLPVISIFAAASFSKLQGGIRYLLPIYPFLFVWVSGLVTIKISRWARTAKAVFYGLCIWYFLSSIMIYPDYLAYYNELVGGPNGFGYKISADADWGQDYKELKKYMDKEGIKSVKLLCFGAVDPAYYGIKYEDLAKEEYKKPVAGRYYAISSRLVEAVKWADEYTPVARIAHTIFMFHIEDKNK